MKKILLLLLLLYCINIFAKTDYFVYPFGYYSDETSVALGASSLIFSSHESKKYQIIFVGSYSLENQTSLRIQNKFSDTNSRYLLDFEGIFKNWPSSFYLEGNNSTDLSEQYSKKYFSLKFSPAYKITDNHKIGIEPKIIRYNYKDVIEGGMLENSDFLDNNEINSIGFFWQYDTKDNSNFPQKGIFIENKFSLSNKLFSSDKNYQVYRFEFDYYKNFYQNHTFAFQTIFRSASSDSPLIEKSFLGDNIRAINSSRFYDNHLCTLRGELRSFPFSQKLLDRFGIVLFTEIGQVSDKITNFDLDEFKFSFGFGFRFLVLPKEKVTVRVDAGFHDGNIKNEIKSFEAF